MRGEEREGQALHIIILSGRCFVIVVFCFNAGDGNPILIADPQELYFSSSLSTTFSKLVRNHNSLTTAGQ